MLRQYTGHVALVAAFLLGSIRPLLAAPPPAPPAPATITTLPGDSLNLKVVEHLNDHYVVVQVAPPVHNWFAGNFTNLPTDKETTIGLSMEAMDTPGNKADVKKWVGLRPVMTYADPTKYESYEWFTKDDNGRWVSGDLFKQGDAKFAGTGKVPEQSAIPKEVAEQFLSEDGTYWQPWREIDHAEAVTGLNIFRMQQRFAYPTATVAMRVPYTYTYQQEFITRLRAANIPGVLVDEIGETSEKRKIQLIRIETTVPAKEQKDHRPTILAYSREHSTEHDSSHVTMGMLRWLISKDQVAVCAYEQVNWLLLPILDIDASIHSINNSGDMYTAAFAPPEAVATARYMINWLDTNHRIDVVVDLHNVECTESENVACPYINTKNKEFTKRFNTTLFANLRRSRYSVGQSNGWGSGSVPLRFAGYCERSFSVFDLYFEVNTRRPDSRMNIEQTQRVGELLALDLYTFRTDTVFHEIELKCDAWMAQRDIKRKAWWKSRGYTAGERTDFDLLVMGY